MRFCSVLLIVLFTFNQFSATFNVFSSWKFWKAITKNDQKTENEEKMANRRVGVGGIIPFKKVERSEIMGSIQLGIQQAIGSSNSVAERELFEDDFMAFDPKVFKHSGSNPHHKYSEFTFTTYAPIAFSYFRDMYGIQTHDFLVSFCSAPLRELGNPGASGSLFYLTQDDEFIMKTVEQTEAAFLKHLLRGFYDMFTTQSMRLVAMNNLLPSSIKIHSKFDLKGSTYQRRASGAEMSKKLPTYKDLDFKDMHKKGLYLEAEVYDVLVGTIRRDCRFLAMYKIMDYSLLLGIHNVDEALREKEQQNLTNASSKASCSQTVDESDNKRASPLSKTSSKPVLRRSFSFPSDETQQVEAYNDSEVHRSSVIEDDLPPGGIPAFNEKGERLLLFLGIIDILQYYRIKKKVEHAFKSIMHDGDTISVHEPKFYAQRFQDFLEKAVFRRMAKSSKHSQASQRVPSP